MYRIINDDYVELYTSPATRQFVSTDDEEYQKWLAEGNTPVPKSGTNRFTSDSEKRIDELELYILMQEGLI